MNITNEWFDLPLNDGFTNDWGLVPQYCKIGGLLALRGLIKHENGVMPLNFSFATLPEGFRPNYATDVLTNVSATGGGGFVRLRISATTGAMLFDYTSNQTSLNVNANITCVVHL